MTIVLWLSIVSYEKKLLCIICQGWRTATPTYPYTVTVGSLVKNADCLAAVLSCILLKWSLWLVTMKTRVCVSACNLTVALCDLPVLFFLVCSLPPPWNRDHYLELPLFVCPWVRPSVRDFIRKNHTQKHQDNPCLLDVFLVSFLLLS